MTEIKKINDRVRELRAYLGLGRAAFEKETGIKRKTVENIERGEQGVTTQQLEAIDTRWPEYGYWLAYGKTLPEAGQISPELEKIREDSKREGTG